MKKFITTLCLIFSLIFAFSAVGCGSSSWKVGYTKGTVVSNGGFAVEIVAENNQSYTYFINGVGDSTANNKFGKPVQGALVRVKTSELAQGANAQSAEVVVPKLFVSSFYGADVGYKSGLTIFGDYVYYGTPNTEKDKKGNVKNTEIVFQKTKLDGTGTTDIATFEGLSTEYRFSQSNGKVYLTVIERIAGSSDSDPATYNIFVYEEGTKIFEREAVDSLILPYEFEGDYIFFTDLEKGEDEQDKKYGSIYSYKYGDSEEKVLLSGKNDFDGGISGAGVQGRTYIVDKFVNDILYFSHQSADTTDGTEITYSFLNTKASGVAPISKLTEEATDTQKSDFNTQIAKNLEKVVVMSGQYVKNAIIPTALYADLDEIYYFDSSIGIVSYNYTTSEVAPYFGLTEVVGIAKIEIASPTFKGFIEDYAYFTDSNSFVYRIKYKNLASGEVAEIEQISTVAVNTSWYLPEVVAGNLLVPVSGEPYNNYIYAFNLDIEADAEAYFKTELEDVNSEATEAKAKGELVDLYLEEIANKEEKAIEYTAGKRVGVLKSADKEVVENYISNLNTSTSSSSSN